MPTVLRRDGFHVVIYTRGEHLPPHVHVFRADEEIVMDLEPMAVRDNFMRPKNAARAWLLVAENLAFLTERWDFHWSKQHG
jgi:hypothetical protein